MNRQVLSWIPLIGSLVGAGLMALNQVEAPTTGLKAAGRSPGGEGSCWVKPSTSKACTEEVPCLWVSSPPGGRAQGMKCHVCRGGAQAVSLRVHRRWARFVRQTPHSSDAATPQRDRRLCCTLTEEQQHRYLPQLADTLAGGA